MTRYYVPANYSQNEKKIILKTADAQSLESRTLAQERGRQRKHKGCKGCAGRARAVQSGRLVFLKPGCADWRPEPLEVVCSVLRRPEGWHQSVTCVELQPLPRSAELPVQVARATDLLGFIQEFPRMWRQATPGSSLERGMVEGVELLRLKRSGPPPFSTMWREVAAGAPEPGTAADQRPREEQGGAEHSVAPAAHGCFWASPRCAILASRRRVETLRLPSCSSADLRPTAGASQAAEAKSAVGAELRREPTFVPVGTYRRRFCWPLGRESLRLSPQSAAKKLRLATGTDC